MVLFGISIAAAAIAPRPQSTEPAEEEASMPTSSASEEAVPSGGGVEAETVDASSEAPKTVRAGVGDQLALTVTSRSFLEVEIADLGLVDSAAPGAPARFDLLLRDPGELEITNADEGEIVGRLLVEPGSADQ